MARVTVTGHRPNKLGGYRAHDNFKAIRRHMRDFLNEAPEGELCLISGGALGIDKFWIEVGLHLELPVIAALPFEGYNNKWPLDSRKEYEKLLDRCHEVVYISEPGYKPSKLQTRNEWMVDNSDVVTAYWDGSEGGTMNCIEYARHKKKVLNIFELKDII